MAVGNHITGAKRHPHQRRRLEGIGPRFLRSGKPYGYQITLDRMNPPQPEGGFGCGNPSLSGRRALHVAGRIKRDYRRVEAERAPHQLMYDYLALEMQ
jgi:hypothetical protein